MESKARNPYSYPEAQIAVASLIGALAAIIGVAAVGKRSLLLLLLVPALLVGYHQRGRLRARGRAGLIGFMLAIIMFFAADIVRAMLANFANLPEWDFKLFWLFGRVAAQGQNIYQPEFLHALAVPLHPSDEMMRELFFFYPPPTMFLFAPLGWFEIHTALVVWYMFNAAIIGLDIYLLWRIFLKHDGHMGLLLAAALLLMLPASKLTIMYAQTNFIVLLALLLFWLWRDRPRGAIWLAIGLFVKPLLVFLPLYLVLRRRWRLLCSIAVAGSSMLLLSAAVFGPNTVLSYFTANPVVNSTPVAFYTEEVCQSLLATILRLTRYDFSNSSPYTQPLFLLSALIITAVTSWLIYKLEESQADWMLALATVLALLLYTRTLTHYSVLLIAPIALIWSRRQQLPGQAWSAIAFITVEYTLINLGNGWIFLAMALSWLALVGVSARSLLHRPILEHTSATRLGNSGAD
jgi:hypothetical protein